MNDAKKISLCLAVIAVLGLVVYQAAKSRGQTAAEEIQQDLDTDTEAAPMIPEGHSRAGAPSDQSTSSSERQVPSTLPLMTQEASVLQKTPLSEKEIKSVRQLSTILARSMGNANLVSITNEIKSGGLKPTKIVDENPYTGRLTILRTEDALEGTRYLHIQIIGSTPKAEFMQHSSFQIRPGSNSFAKGVEMMQKALPAGSKVKEKSEGYQTWTVPGGYVARVYTMSLEDLKASKYNAVSKDDVGSTNMVVEQEIHDSEDEH